MKSLAKNTTFNVIYNIANMIFPLITSMFVARVLLTDGVGQVAYGQNIVSYFVVFAALGLPTYGVREVARVREHKTMTNKLFTELFSINFISTMASLIVYVVMIFSFSSFQNDYLLFMCCGLQILMNVINIDWFYQGNEDYVYIACRSIVVKLISLVAVVCYVRTRDDYIIYALISSLGVCANYVFNIIHVRKFVRLDFHGLHFKRHLKPLVILALSAFLSSLYSKVDITMLGNMSSKSITGLYSNSYKIAEMIIVVSSSISAVFLPRLCYFYQNDKEEFHKLINLGVKILSFITFPIAVGTYVLAPQIMMFMYGESFAGGAITLRIFSFMIIIKSFGNLLCYQLVIATGNEKKRLPAYLLAAIINIILNACLIPVLAQNGAAIASIVSEVVVNGIQLFAMIRILNLSISFKPIFVGLITSCIMGIPVYIVQGLITIPIAACLSGFGIGVLVYFGLNILFKNEILCTLKNMIREKMR